MKKKKIHKIIDRLVYAIIIGIMLALLILIAAIYV